MAGYNDYEADDASCAYHPFLGNTCDGVMNPTGSATFTYDLVGNRTGYGDTIEIGNRMVAFRRGITHYSMTYDTAGNLEHKCEPGGSFDQWFYWSATGQLDSVWVVGTETVRFRYDGFGRRIMKWTDTDTTRYLWDGYDLFMELDGSGSIEREYTYWPGVDKPHSVRIDGVNYYFATDIVGNVRGLFDASSNVHNAYYYYPFGERQGPPWPYTIDPDIEQHLGFAARMWDEETGLY